MSDPPPPRAPPIPPLNIPSAALHIHSCARDEQHPDSEVAIRHERQRVAKELEPVRRKRAATPSEANTEHDPRDELSRYASTQADDVPQEMEDHNATTPCKTRFYDPIAKFWRTQISLVMEEGSLRDHLALERTFLGYLRTSLLLVVTGVIIAQLFRLQHSPHPQPHFGFYKIGKPLSATFICMGIVVVLVGAIRFWRLQNALMRGKAIAAGWEVNVVMGLVGSLMLGTFGLILGVDIDKMYFGG
ncbi:hypothetical protein COCCADRAFT_37672 [Bipolaris zeicola 26-R-13]|uniref:DUF202 domain-containing protein n=1 Tax=Cochliobolus carbonum (strain 26-R-13) TaxID=930089 RepID=W6YLW1_COCC2|nr:uncharacterized protein COCCADRAFT_37672 [Bipolaris zeicola 26-R-13]EUC32366.1 hypothetical protein COCCADRAFT_37672 [Bipolaris zeicola 26-R-13]